MGNPNCILAKVKESNHSLLMVCPLLFENFLFKTDILAKDHSLSLSFVMQTQFRFIKIKFR